MLRSERSFAHLHNLALGAALVRNCRFICLWQGIFDRGVQSTVLLFCLNNSVKQIYTFAMLSCCLGRSIGITATVLVQGRLYASLSDK